MNARIALEDQPSLPVLQWNDGLALSAKEHCMDMGSKGMYGHLGSERQSFVDRLARYGFSSDARAQITAYQRPSPDDMILQMIIGDEVPNKTSRGYMKLWNPYFSEIGIGACTHVGKGNMAVITLASYYSPNELGRQ